MTAFSSTTAAPPMREYTVPPGARTMQPRNGSAATNYFTGGLVMHRYGSDIVEHPLPASPRTDLIAVGCVVGATAAYTTGATSDANGGALLANGLPDSITIETGVVAWFDTGTGAHQITNANVDQVCYAFDNNTLYLDNLNGTLSAAGYVAQVRADGKVKLRIDPSVYLNAQDPLPGATLDDTVAYVATNIPAGTFASGVFTVTATGAMPTQDGQTVALGDKMIFPAGTITTQAVTAAQSGVYECTQLGATGVKAIWTRSAKWASGAVITPETKIRVAFGTLFAGTTWRADPATATKLVDTDDPVLYPEKVTQTVTLSSSAAAIINVPIKSATKSTVHAALAAVGGTTTNTIGYGIIVAPTPGGIGTATTTVNAIASGGTKNGTADTSQLIATIFN